MAFYIQDPSYQKSAYLHEALISACVDGITGGGAYAFASKAGIELLIEDDNFNRFLKTGKFMLVVGMDDITNIYSIECLRKLQEKYKNHLFVKAYVHNSKGSTFHPKYSWFAKENGGVMVLGSGNLTQKGLRQNREAYTINTLNKREMDEVIDEWNSWINHSNSFLLDIDDEIVLECAKQNTKRMHTLVNIQKDIGQTFNAERLMKYIDLLKVQPQDKVFKNIKKDKIIDKDLKDTSNIDVVMYDEDLDIDLLYWTFFLNSEALIAEIPRSGTRWSQVNFDKNTFENFFGATCGENGTYRILFRNMKCDGSLSKAEIRPSVSVSSQNYRFELDAAKGLDYPEGKNRPIGVFVKVAPRDFIYELIMPDDEAYNDCLVVLDSKEAYSPNRMRRIRVYCSEIYNKADKLVIWKRLDVEEDE